MHFRFTIHIICLIYLCSCANESTHFSQDNCSPKGQDSLFILTTQSDWALLASRILSMEELQSILRIQYFHENGVKAPGIHNQKVELTFCSNGKSIKSSLQLGVSQDDILKAKKGDLNSRLDLLRRSPFAIAHRHQLAQIHILARRRFDLYGWGDVAFYDLAEYAATKLIADPSKAYLFQRDQGDKGYLNTFNHITAQAFITSMYSKELADYVADVHERHNMPELIHGVFSMEQLAHPDDNPVDNYVDMINNEIGQNLGLELKKKYSIDLQTTWTPRLLANYLNDLQNFYARAFRIRMLPFKKEDLMVKRFVRKLNTLNTVSLNKA